MDAFRTLPLRTKLLSAFLLVSLVTVIVGVFGAMKLKEINEADTFLYTRVTVPLGEISDIGISFQRLRINLRDEVEATDPAVQAQKRATIKELQQRIKERLDSFEKTIITEEGRKDFAELVKARDAYVASTNTILELDAAGKDAEARAVISGAGRVAAQDYQKMIDKLIASKEQQGKLTDLKNNETARTASILLYAFIVAGFAVSVTLGVLLTKSVMAQLGEDPGYLSEVAGKIAGGDLDVAFRPQKQEGGVYHVIQGMVRTMKGKIAEAEQKTNEAAEQARLAKIATDEANEAKARAERAKAEGMIAAAQQLEKVVEVVSSASEELSAQVEQSSRGAEAQAARVGETATAMEEMNSTVLEVAKNASQAAESTESARKKASEGSGVVRQVVEGIGEMQRVSQNLKTDMEALGKQAEGIGQVMGVINDIADQTNLLALNAAIEAARAGDAGRGFAVVADEVRKLAEKTMAATKEVGEAISGIQQGARKNLENVEHSAHTVEQATALAQKSGEALGEIVTMVDGATDQVRSIATASEQQSATSEEINRSIEDINRISSETADAMRQSAQAVGELASQAQKLRALIEQMKRGG